MMREVGKALPAQSRQMAPAALEQLTREVTEVGAARRVRAVVSLDAPEWPPLPEYLRRADLDGRSVYTRPGTERFATGAQLTMEERLIGSAQRAGAPCLTRADAARALGADAAALDAALHQGARDARNAQERDCHRAAPGPGRVRVSPADLTAHRGGSGRPGRRGQDAHPRAGRARLARLPGGT